MNQQEKGIATLIRSAVTTEKLPLPAGFDLERCVPHLMRHQIASLAYQGAVNCGISKQLPAMRQLFQRYGRDLLLEEKQRSSVEKLCTAFEEHQIDYLLLKGCVLKDLYPRRELRAMGDADILIRPEQYDEICEIVRNLGYQEAVSPDYTRNWKTDDLYLELHLSLLSAKDSTRDLYARFGDGWSRAIPICGHRYGFRSEDEYLFIFLHFVKHYRLSGIGCRHLTDLWVYHRAHPEMDQNYLQAELNKINLLEFHSNLLRTIAAWFEDGAEDEITQLITAHINQKGCWGEFSSLVLAQGAFRRGKTGEKGNITQKTALRIAFPPVSTLVGVYPALRRCPYLLPIFWAVRCVDVVRLRRGNIKKRVKELQIVTPERVADFEETMRKVGLNYSFNEIMEEE